MASPPVPEWKKHLDAHNASIQAQIDELLNLFRSSQTSSSSGLLDHSNPRGPMVRLDVPRFDGEDPHTWIFKIEEYFHFHNTPDAQRLQIVAFHLDGKASTWFQWLKSQQLLSSWSDFLSRVKSRFGDSQFADPEGTLAKLTQQGNVADYQSTFESLMGRTTGISEPLLISFYISGLKPSIRRDLQLNRPATLDETFALSRAFESKYLDTQSETRTFARSFSQPTAPTVVSSPTTTNVSPPASHRPPSAASPISTARRDSPIIPVRELTPAQTREKRARGLCFNCDQKWNPSHRCKSPHSVMLLASDDVDPSPEDLEFPEPTEHPPDDGVILADVSSLHSLSGSAQPRSLRLWGSLHKQRFQVMIDNGSTHNFITPDLAESLKLHVVSIPQFRVYIGNGDSILCTTKCLAVPINLQGTSFTLDLFVLPIKGPDIILGVQWLQELGPVTHDYRCGRMEFEWHDKKIILEGDRSLASRQITFSILQSLLVSDVVEEIYELWPVHTTPIDYTVSALDLERAFPSLREVLHEFCDVFETPRGLPPRRLFDHRIHLEPDSKPINVRPYRYPYFQKNEMERLVREMLDQGIIRPSHSPFSSPVLLVKKKDDSYRFCVDYRALNAATIKDKFPIPTVDELLDELGHSVVFSKLDLRAGFHQIRIHDKDIFKTAFRTHEGHFEFLVMPFGLTNAPSTFQANMNFFLKDFLRRFVVVFFDDILIYSPSLEEHVVHLRTVLSCLRDNQLYVKFSKCSFGTHSVEYLGHIVSAGAVRADPTKIDAMLSWPVPSSLKQLRGFLGLTGYYRKFVRHYATIAAPLTDLLRKDGFTWSPSASTAFDALKQAMSSTPILRLPDFSKPFIIETDASDVGLGAVLLQDNLPIAYHSRKLGARLSCSSTYIKELHAISEAIGKWRQYILGRRFVIRTDHHSLKELLHQQLHTPDQHRYIRKLLGYDFVIEYKPGRHNIVADALSRAPDNSSSNSVETPLLAELDTFSSTCFTIQSVPVASFLDKLRTENRTHAEYLSYHCRFQAGDLSPDYSVVDGLLLYRHRYFLIPASALKQDLLREFHCSPVHGHGGVKKTLVGLSNLFYWQNMRRDVEAFVRACTTCQQVKTLTVAPAGLLQPLPLPALVWNELTMDFITHLPLSRGFSVILVVVDRLTKAAHFGPLPSGFTASKVARLFTDMVVRLHGFPSSIISDRDPVFLSRFWSELFKLSGTSLKHSSAYHPQTDGQSEVVNRCLEQYLRALTSDRPAQWTEFLGWAEFHYNTSYHSSINMSPFQAMYGRLPATIPRYIPSSTAVDALDALLLERDQLLSDLKSALSSAQHRMQLQANKHRRDVSFSVGDLVLVRLQPYRQVSIARRPSPKLAKRYFGPYPVLEKVGAVAYRLELPAGCRIHPVFHVSLLKPFVGSATTPLNPVPLDSDGFPSLVPLVIISSRTILRHGNPEAQVLVQWQGHPPDAATWEPLASFRASFPDFHLEDKVVFDEGGVDTTVDISDHAHVEDINAGEEEAELEPEPSLAARRPRRDIHRPRRYNE